MPNTRKIFEQPLFTKATMGLKKFGKEVAEVPLGFAQGIGNIYEDFTNRIAPESLGERATAVRQSIQQRSFAPLQQSFHQQFAQQNPVDLALDFSPMGVATIAPKKPPVFKGLKDLTTKVVERLRGKAVTNKQEILDLSNMPDLKQAERDLIRKVTRDFDERIPVQEFANKVKTELLPLYPSKAKGMYPTASGARYENITLPDELRGPVANYQERIYNSPVSTSAGSSHFSDDAPNYFAHTRIEDLPPSKSKDGYTMRQVGDVSEQRFYTKEIGTTRRVIEIQSDLFQKGRLESEISTAQKRYHASLSTRTLETRGDRIPLPPLKNDAQELLKLEPYRNTWHERIIKEEIKQAAKDRKTKLQFPTGETAMKIEGLGENLNWRLGTDVPLTPQDIQVGETIYQGGQDAWLITEDLGNGKFKAINSTNFPEAIYAVRPDDFAMPARGSDDWASFQSAKRDVENYSEEFDISGKVDTNNPIYRFYEKEVGKYLTNKFGAKRIVDPQGVQWWELDVPKEKARAPIEAFGALPFVLPKKEEKKREVFPSPLFINR